ncbi:UDP-N-acetylglucosamine 2-epimerase (non-hydrolyzing) [Candidatus Pacearchaeota archaeon]|nr:UDP-N-acetylglucosamine 2-epimerase (non-hydrolyzing) [Candidatus Pacearchaeota archaeon]
MKKIMFVVASRPNFMKVAPLVKEEKKRNINFSILYTEQHRSEAMTGMIAEDLEMPNADYSLDLRNSVKSNSKIKKGLVFIKRFIEARNIIKKDNPNIVVVVGDVFSSVYATLIAKTLKIKVAHVEAGLRSFNNKMPEERSRKIIDRYADFLFTTEEEANANLIKEGKDKLKIFLVGNIMIDSLIKNVGAAKKIHAYKKFGLKKRDYAVLTFHRHENITNKERITSIIYSLNEIVKRIKVIFPLHPATKKQLIKYGLLDSLTNIKGLKIANPLGYLDMINLVMNSSFVITDSGGLQEETTYLRVPCLTIRTETERPITVKVGTNTIVGLSEEKILFNVDNILNKRDKSGKIPYLWDGKTASRIIEILKNN